MIERSGKKYYTVREFAAKAKVSNQAIYKQVGNQLATYLIMVDNQKFIEESALFDVYGIEVDNQVDNQKNTQEAAAAAADREEGQADVSKELIEMLKEEIKKKDQQIERLQQRLDHAHDLIADMAQKAQYITAADKTEKILLQQTKEDPEEVIAFEAENQNTERKNDTEEKPKKKWFQFWKRS